MKHLQLVSLVTAVSSLCFSSTASADWRIKSAITDVAKSVERAANVEADSNASSAISDIRKLPASVTGTPNLPTVSVSPVKPGGLGGALTGVSIGIPASVTGVPGGFTITLPGGGSSGPTGITITTPGGGASVGPDGVTITTPGGGASAGSNGVTITTPGGSASAGPNGVTITTPGGSGTVGPQGATFTPSVGPAVKIGPSGVNTSPFVIPGGVEIPGLASASPVFPLILLPSGATVAPSAPLAPSGSPATLLFPKKAEEMLRTLVEETQSEVNDLVKIVTLAPKSPAASLKAAVDAANPLRKTEERLGPLDSHISELQVWMSKQLGDFAPVALPHILQKALADWAQLKVYSNAVKLAGRSSFDSSQRGQRKYIAWVADWIAANHLEVKTADSDSEYKSAGISKLPLGVTTREIDQATPKDQFFDPSFPWHSAPNGTGPDGLAVPDRLIFSRQDVSQASNQHDKDYQSVDRTQERADSDFEDALEKQYFEAYPFMTLVFGRR